MKRLLLAAALGVVGLFAAAGTASADVGDITHLQTDSDLTGSASEVEVTGDIRCQATIDYGLVVKVTQNPPDTNSIDGDDDPDSSSEGVGAFGPNQGNENNTPCSQSLQSFDVVVEQNRDSGDFFDWPGSSSGPLGVIVVAGTSAENGDRGPGPFIGDMEYSTTLADFERVR